MFWKHCISQLRKWSMPDDKWSFFNFSNLPTTKSQEKIKFKSKFHFNHIMKQILPFGPLENLFSGQLWYTFKSLKALFNFWVLYYLQFEIDKTYFELNECRLVEWAELEKLGFSNIWGGRLVFIRTNLFKSFQQSYILPICLNCLNKSLSVGKNSSKF